MKRQIWSMMRQFNDAPVERCAGPRVGVVVYGTPVPALLPAGLIVA